MSAAEDQRDYFDRPYHLPKGKRNEVRKGYIELDRNLDTSHLDIRTRHRTSVRRDISVRADSRGNR